jgi:hypothetical protein
MMERDDVIDITTITSTNDGFRMRKNIWTIEVACDDDSDRSVSTYTSMRESLHRLISVYGEEVDDVLVRRIYIVKQIT